MAELRSADSRGGCPYVIPSVESSWRGLRRGTRVQLLPGADAAGLSGAACLSGPNVVAVTSVVGRHNIWERCTIAFRIELNAVTDQGAELHRIHKDAGHGTR